MSLCVLLAAGDAAGAAREQASLVAAIKATYLYKVAPFVTWPAPPQGSFTICTTGDDDVTALAPQVVANQQVNGVPISLRNIADSKSADGCQILYIADNAPDPAGALAGKPILTVAGRPDANGEIVRFVVVGDHVRFDIDNRQAEDSGLKISSKLLSLAHRTTGGAP
ncbi:MAG TPA: YfiR family protein [Rhizomicrobium sp.]|nr:YfiR family protein [Rhizomicrobium sp.]